MSKSGTRRARKQRRASKAILRYGRNARPTHKRIAGRTGDKRKRHRRRNDSAQGVA